MVQLRNIECRLRTDERGLLEEYEDAEDNGERYTDVCPSAIVYVKTGTECFSIDVTPNIELSVWVYFDGKRLREGTIASPLAPCTIDRAEFYKNGRWMASRFQFSQIDISEDVPIDHSKSQDIANLGEIEVRVFRWVTTGPSYAKTSGTSNLGIDRVQSLHEKQLKGKDLTHSVGLANSTPVIPKSLARGYRLDTDFERPWASFKFRYRSERALKGLGLLPRTPSPSPSASPEPVAEEIRALSREELEAEVLRLRNLSQPSPSVKQEKKPAVKRERADSAFAGPSNSQPAKKKKPKVIDLTADSDEE